MEKPKPIYCPICQRIIEPELDLQGEPMPVYVHDEIKHSDDDIDALEHGVQ